MHRGAETPRIQRGAPIFRRPAATTMYAAVQLRSEEPRSEEPPSPVAGAASAALDGGLHAIERRTRRERSAAVLAVVEVARGRERVANPGLGVSPVHRLPRLRELKGVADAAAILRVEAAADLSAHEAADDRSHDDRGNAGILVGNGRADQPAGRPTHDRADRGAIAAT